jgi:hypothetical protein
MAKPKPVQSFEARRDKFLTEHNLKDAYDALITSETPEAVAEALNGLIDAMEKYVDSIPVGRPDDKISSGFFCVEIVANAAKSLPKTPDMRDNFLHIFKKSAFLRRAVDGYAGSQQQDTYQLRSKLDRQVVAAFNPETNPQVIDPRMTERLRHR